MAISNRSVQLNKMTNDKEHLYYLNDEELEEIFKQYKSGLCLRFFKEYSLSENFLIKHLDDLEWKAISQYQILSENFIKEFKDKVEWDYIVCYQKLSSDFIEEFMFLKFSHPLRGLNMDFISYNQILSITFMKKHKDKLNWRFIFDADLFRDQDFEELEYYIYSEVDM